MGQLSSRKPTRGSEDPAQLEVKAFEPWADPDECGSVDWRWRALWGGGGWGLLLPETVSVLGTAGCGGRASPAAFEGTGIGQYWMGTLPSGAPVVRTR